jgi:hypothetical protein
MRHTFGSKMVRLVAVGALASSAALAFAPSGVAGAAVGIKCTKMSGSAAKSVKLSGCSGNTGGASKAIPGSSLATGGTIKWVNGKKTSVTFTVKTKGTACKAGWTEYQAKGTVTKDNTGSAPVGSVAKGSVCVNNTTLKVSLVPGTKITI